MAEAVRFELTEHFYSSVFKTGAINQTLPHFHKLGGDGWIRANDLLRMKQLHYHCATSPLVPDSGNDPLTYRLSSDCSTSELIGYIGGR